MARYIGLDVHARSCTAVTLNERGKQLACDRLETNGDVLVRFIKLQPKGTHVCFEEGTQSQWLYEILRPHAASVTVIVPAKHRGTKNDERDAHGAAEAIRTKSAITRVFKDDGRLTKLRDLSRTYSMIVEDSARTQSRIRSFFRARGVVTSNESLFVTSNRSDLLSRVPATCRDALSMLFQQLDVQTPIREMCEESLVTEAKRHRAYRWISSVPGLGPIRTARTIAIVVTPSRFAHRDEFWQYCGLGLVSVVSGEWDRSRDGAWERSRNPRPLGLNRNHNRVLKDVFKGAAKTVIMNMPKNPLHMDYERQVAAGTEPNLAELTLARKIAAITLAVWKREEVYDPTKGCTR